MLHLGDADAVGRIHRLPIGSGVEIEVLPVDGDSFRLEKVRDMVGEPAQGLGIAEVQQPVGISRKLGQPFRVLAVEPGRFIDALGLEPEDDPFSPFPRSLGDWLQAPGESLPAGEPAADARPPGLGGVLVPSRVDPAGLRVDPELAEAVDHGQGVAFRGADVLVAGERPAESDAVAERKLDWSFLRPWGVMGEDEPPEEVVPGHPVAALPEEQGGRRRAHFLARLEPEVGPLHSGIEAEGAWSRLFDRRLPLAAPADGGHYSSFRRGDVEKGESRRI